jgi:hypothetical protein
MVRHPCAVVLSRMQWNWATDGDIEPLLRQDKLVADFLSGKLDAIGRTTSEEGKHAIVWCISNLVPLAQFASGELTVVHYENLVASPRREVPKIFASIGQPFCADVYDRIAIPSTTTLRNRRNLAPERRMADWTSALSPEQIRNILDVVEWFGLDHLYGPAVMPVEPHP